jgi:hypothetical protein
MLEAIAAVCGILGNLALVATVLVLLREVRINTRLTRAANSQSMVELAAPLYQGLAQDRALAELFARGAADFDSLDHIDRQRYRSLLTVWLMFFENVYYQRRQRFLEGRAFQPWWDELKHFIVDRNLARHWAELQGFFQEEFAHEVTGLIASLVPFSNGAAVLKPFNEPRPSGSAAGAP